MVEVAHYLKKILLEKPGAKFQNFDILESRIRLTVWKNLNYLMSPEVGGHSCPQFVQVRVGVNVVAV